MDHDEYETVLRSCGGVQRRLSPKERRVLVQSWREVYAAPLHRRTGRWKDGEFDWHVFSGQSTGALNAAKAEAAYKTERVHSVLVVPESDDFDAVAIDLPQGTDRHPVFSGLYGDVLVWPPDLSWTMAYTHEQEAGLGPYFSRKEWTFDT